MTMRLSFDPDTEETVEEGGTASGWAAAGGGADPPYDPNARYQEVTGSPGEYYTPDREMTVGIGEDEKESRRRALNDTGGGGGGAGGLQQFPGEGEGLYSVQPNDPEPEQQEASPRQEFEEGGYLAPVADYLNRFRQVPASKRTATWQVKRDGGIYFQADTEEEARAWMQEQRDNHRYNMDSPSWSVEEKDFTKDSMRKGAPFADYADFADCVAKNGDKDDPEAYCGKIKHQVEDSKSARHTAMDPNDMWVYVDADGTESGWFTSAEKAEMDSVGVSGAYTWRKLAPEEVASFNSWVGDLTYQQASKKQAYEIEGANVCKACYEGDHDECTGVDENGVGCMCIDMEHDGDQWGEYGKESKVAGDKRSSKTAAVQVHEFGDSADAYGQVQWNEKIKGGDVLVIPSEKVVGFAFSAWPAAVTKARGHLHGLTDPTGPPAGESYDSPEEVAAWAAGWAKAREVATAKGWPLATSGDDYEDEPPSDNDWMFAGSKKKTALSLTNVGIDGPGVGIGTDPSGNRVKFRLSEKDEKDLKSVLYSDLAVNFSGVDVEEGDIIKDSRKTAYETEGPFKVQVAGVGENVWSENALRFQTEEEAKAYASDLLGRWFGADMARVVSSDTPTRAAVEPGDSKIVINYRTGARRRAMFEIAIHEVEPGDILVLPDGRIDRKKNRVAKVDGFNGMWVVDFTNGTATRPLGNGKVLVVREAKTAGNPYKPGTPNWFDWEEGGGDPASHGPSSGVPDDIFPGGGVPLHGDLTPEQEAWMKSRKRSTRHTARSLSEIAAEIRKDWRPPNYAAAPYLEAMLSLDTMRDNYGAESASSIVAYFLSNASQWKGETAKRIKAELRSMQKGGSRTKVAWNYYLDMIEDDNGDLVDIEYYHNFCAPPEVKAKGGWPAPDWPDYDVYCAGCGELIHEGIESEGAHVGVASSNEEEQMTVRDPRNPRGLYGGDSNILLQDRALDLHDEERREQLEVEELKRRSGARSDYAHWNEDQDYMWYQEEGRFPEEPPEQDDYYDGPEEEAPEEGEESVCQECGEDIVVNADGEWVGDNNSTMCGNTYGHTPGGSSYVSGYGDITPQQERAQMGITGSRTAAGYDPDTYDPDYDNMSPSPSEYMGDQQGDGADEGLGGPDDPDMPSTPEQPRTQMGSRRPFVREAGMVAHPDPDGGISSRDAGPYIQEGWEGLVDSGMSPEDATERLHSLPDDDDDAGLHEAGWLHDILNFGNPDKWGEVHWEPGMSIEDAPTKEEWEKEHGKEGTLLTRQAYTSYMKDFDGSMYQIWNDSGEVVFETFSEDTADEELARLRSLEPEAEAPGRDPFNFSDLDLSHMEGHEGSRQAMPNPVDLGVKVGDIFYSSWGYDQTNVDWYEVTGMTGASVRVRPIGARIESSSGVGQDYLVPVPGSFRGPEMTKRIQGTPGSSERIDRPYFRVDYGSGAWLWDGKPKYQTSSGWGH